MKRKQYIHPDVIARCLATTPPGDGPVTAESRLWFVVDNIAEGEVRLIVQTRTTAGYVIREWELPWLKSGDVREIDLTEWRTVFIGLPERPQ